MIKKYRKKLVVIEAVRLEKGSGDTINLFMGNKVDWEYRGGELYLKIKTIKGTMIANYGDYIIKGVKGEFYPCKPDIFEQTYEEIK